ncbi:unnamed protein product [Caenorhabditis auriculariae]|uniref:BPTI/Kunitz inhibitor domain-containing protein n=1 Tax=Caenorhabditis auriculariae TaxID=2777116 RepID=A0A8S1HPW0_9PELO|nr:unnamed protein product [Caenorhabditis auriculariae]
MLHVLFASFLSNAVAHELGGVVCRLPKNVGYTCGVTSPHSAFYFDADIGECLEFIFEGCGGNQNRFGTKEDCIEGCRSLTLCGVGMPLMDFAGNIKRCDGDRVPCPGSHTCVGSGMSSVCCQKADRICQSNVHGGTPCGVPATTRHYFDFSSKTCRPFAFTGCGGNDNNFKTKGLCMQFCNSEVICPRGEPHADRYSISHIASCMQNSHCPGNYTCTSRLGLKKGACCPSKEFVCGSPFEVRSSCRRPLKESTWWFDFRKGECFKTEHAACDEHFNSFANQEQCTDYCIGTCPNDLEVHFNPRNGQPQLCDAKKNEGCPLGYECVKSSPYAAICCKTNPVCPAAESIALVKEEGVIRCDPDDYQSCPSQYSCQQAKNLENICCTLPLECPTGMVALREDGGRPRACSIGVDGNCPYDHMCVQGEGSASIGGARHLCCKPQKKCVVPYVNIDSKRPQRDKTCPTSTLCLPALEDAANITNAIDVMFFCCHTVHVYTCSDGSMPVVDETTNKPAKCLASNPFSCPSEHVCSSLLDGTWACCPNSAATNFCVEALLADDGAPVTCKGWDDNSCPRGKCRKAVDGLYYCCKTYSIENVPQIGLTTSPETEQSTRLRGGEADLRICREYGGFTYGDLSYRLL